MTKARLVTLLVVGLGLLLVDPGRIAAQLGTTASVAGKVVDEKDQPVQGAEVVIKSLQTARECTAKTDKNGEYLCAGLLQGRHEITVKYKGLSNKAVRNVAGGLYGDPTSTAFQNRFNFQVGGERAEAAKKQREEFEKTKVGFDRAVALNNEGKFEEALAELQSVLEKESTQWVVHAQLGVAYQGLNRLDDAATAYQKAIELNPSNPHLYATLGEVYLKQKRVEEARKMFETAAQLSPEDAAQFYYKLAVSLYNIGELKAGIEPLKKVLEIDPNYANAHFFMGVFLYSSAETKIEGGEVKTILLSGTVESFQRYLELEPNGRYANDAKQYLQIIEAQVPAAVRIRKK